LWSAKYEVYGVRVVGLECARNGRFEVAEAHAGRKKPFEDRRTWRRLLARLHPDAGGDHELFLFACALKDEVCPERLFAGGPAADQSFSTWRSTMGSWASRNRDTLRGSRPPRGGRSGYPF
jgi:hypothetical protein